MTGATKLKAPLPYFGGKSGAADLIWERFGDVPNYVDPFCGSLAVLLSRPHAPRTETVNDADGLLSNMWRAVRLDPDAVAYYADAPVVEVDLHAKHITLVNAREDLTARLMADPEFYDAKLAGYFMWGACNWIGSGWCSGEGPWVAHEGRLVRREKGQLAGVSRKLPHLGDAGKGVSKQLPHLGDAGKGVSKQLPHLGNAGAGDSSPGIARKVPYLASAGAGDTRASLDSEGVRRKLPNLSSHGSGMNSEYAQTAPGVLAWMRDLSARLKRVRITCGDWTRVLGDSVTTKHGVTAVLLDPPYDAEDAQNDVYGAAYDSSVAKAALEWAIANGDNPSLRVAYCGYDLAPPPGWVAVPWKARKGYQSVKDDGGHNGHREVILFSPHCLKPKEAAMLSLWGDA